jgi:hypothetical protein
MSSKSASQKIHRNQDPGMAASARCSSSLSWRRKKKIPAETKPIATTSNKSLAGPANSHCAPGHTMFAREWS